MTKIKAICFDLDGMFFTNAGKKGFEKNLLSEFGVDEQVLKNFLYRPEVGAMAMLVRGKISPEDFWDEFRKETGIQAEDEYLADLWIKDYEVDEEVAKIVEAAKRAGYTTCVCTNNNKIRLGKLKVNFDLDKYFDVIISSHEVGETKPHKIIFEKLIEQTGFLPEEISYADDNPERLEGAHELGINTFQFHNFTQFLEQLEKLGVNLESNHKIHK